VLEPDDDPKSNKLDVVITPKRSGELFLYVNESCGVARVAGLFYEDNAGKATITVAASSSIQLRGRCHDRSFCQAPCIRWRAVASRTRPP